MYDFFKDLKVVELAGVLAGPSVGYFFSELGAKVIKIENPGTQGDVTRSWKLRSEDPREAASAYFWSLNSGKELIMLDLTSQGGRNRLYELVKTADIVITNYKAGDDVKLQVDYHSLRKIHPTIIYASVNGFGHDSPRIAFDLILQAESGYMSMNGEKGSPGLKMPVALIDVLAGHQLKEGILIALLRREKEKRGSCLSVSLFSSAIASLVNQATNWLIAHELPKPGGSLHPNIAPYGELFETRDKHLITFAIGNNKQFRSLASLLQFGALANDVKFSSNHARVTNRAELYSLLYSAVQKVSFRELSDLCLKDQIPMGKIRNMKEVFELPQAREMIRKFRHNEKELAAVSSVAFKFMD